MRITLPRQVGIVLSPARKSNGLTQAQIAREAGISRQLVNRLEAGSATGIALDKLMGILGSGGCALEVYALSEGWGNIFGTNTWENWKSEMTDLNAYLVRRGIGEDQMERARQATREYVDAYALWQARLEGGMTQMELAEAMGVSQNRVSRMERGDLSVMSLDTIRRYVEALGGTISLVADLPTGKLTLL